MQSVFQSSADLMKVVIDSLHLIDKDTERPWATSEIYHQSYFYMLKRFGKPNHAHDEYKEAGAWSITYKRVTVLVRFASWVEFWIMGSNRDFSSYNTTAYQRSLYRKMEGALTIEYDGRDAEKKGTLDIHLQAEKEFLDLHPEVDSENITQEQFSEWVMFCNRKNRDISIRHAEAKGLHPKGYYDELQLKYSNLNSRHRYMLKIFGEILQDFMTTPVWVRDVPHNIKGFMDEKNIKGMGRDIKLTTKKA